MRDGFWKDSTGTLTFSAGTTWLLPTSSNWHVNDGDLVFAGAVPVGGSTEVAAGSSVSYTDGSLSGTVSLEIAGDSASTANYGRVIWNGTPTITGTINTTLNGYAIAGGEDYLLVDCTGGSGCDSTLAGSSTPGLDLVQTPSAIRAQPANPCDTEWTGLGGDTLWSNAANWSAGVPGSGDAVCMDVTGLVNTDVDTDITVGSLLVANERININAGRP